MLIFLTGFPGCGKSFFGKQVAELMKYDFVDTDMLIEAKEGKTVSEIFKKYGEDYFREKESAVIRSIPVDKNILVATGGGLPCFFQNMEWMKGNGLTVYLEAGAAYLFHRLLKEKSKRPLMAEITDIELMIYITESIAARRSFYEMAEIKVNAENCTPGTLLSAINKKRSSLK